MKKPRNINKIALAMFVFGMLALMAGGYSLVQAREGQNNTTVAQATTHEDLKVDLSWNYFSDYESWPQAATPIDNDYTRYMLHLLGKSEVTEGARFADVNGDGLVDMLYCKDQDYGLFINNGSSQMEPFYVCKYDGGIWYGDCADTK